LTVAVNQSSEPQQPTRITVFCHVISLQITTGSLYILAITWTVLVKPECIGLSNHFTVPARRTNIWSGCLTGRHNGEEWSNENGSEDHGLKFWSPGYVECDPRSLAFFWDRVFRNDSMLGSFTGEDEENITCIQLPRVNVINLRPRLLLRKNCKNTFNGKNLERYPLLLVQRAPNKKGWHAWDVAWVAPPPSFLKHSALRTIAAKE
jgi:hypothetical protein